MVADKGITPRNSKVAIDVTFLITLRDITKTKWRTLKASNATTVEDGRVYYQQRMDAEL